MADIRIKDLPLGTPAATKLLPMDLSTTERASIRDIVFAGRPAASQAEAEAGVNSEKVMTPLTTKQSIASEIGDTLASAAQGALASTSVQPEDLALVASTGLYTDLIGGPEIGSDVVFDVVEGVTSVSISYVPGTLRSVYRNGVRQTEWTATDGSTVTFPVVTSADIGDDGFCEIIVCIGENIGGSTAFNDGRYFLRTDAGVEVGDVLQYESFVGSPFQGVRVKDDGRVWFRRDNDKETDFTNVWITRAPRAFAGPLSGTVHALRVQTDVNYTTAQFEWNAAFILQVNAAGGGEHCASYSQAVKNADGSAWAICLEARDFVQNPTTGTVAIENGLFVKGGDPQNRRIGFHLSLNAADNLPISSTGIVNKIGAGMVLGGPSDYVRVGSMITFQGDAEVHLDMGEVDMGFHDVAMAILPNQSIVVNNPTTVNLDGSRVRGTQRAGIVWSSSQSTWGFSGVSVSSGAAGTATSKAKIIYNGVPYYINLTPV
ncbi:hypothetical protein EON76_05305 [bacterium]|nr:MAG: hypothetical protein EON76_05305 [bacterium]